MSNTDNNNDSEPSLLLECLERTVDELEVLRAVYDDALECDALAAARERIAATTTAAEEEDVVPITLRARLRLQEEEEDVLSLTFPPGYPERTAVKVFCGGFTSRLQARADARIGHEAVWDLVQDWREMLASRTDERRRRKEEQTPSSSADVVEESEDTDRRRPVTAVIAFHHMLIGPGHKKETRVRQRATRSGVRGWMFTGGPGRAVVTVSRRDDLTAWLRECHRAGKAGTCVYWKYDDDDENVISEDVPTKLKTMPYAAGKDTKMDTTAFEATLAKMGIPYPLPPCERPWPF